MVTISDLPDELLVKILSFLSTEEAVSTSILSKRWEFLWMWLSDLKFYCNKRLVRDFINKNLPLHRSPIINSLCLRILQGTPVDETNNFKSWVEIAVSRRVRELICSGYDCCYDEWQIGSLVLATSLYTCNSLVTLELYGWPILVDVPQIACLPSLKTLQLKGVTYANEDSLQLLLCCCPVLEDLLIGRERKNMINLMRNKMRELVIKIPSLQRLSLDIDLMCHSDGCVIVTPSLKYFEVVEDRIDISYLIEHMPELEEANVTVCEDTYMEKILKSITTVKRLSVGIKFNTENEVVYHDALVFTRLENLKLYIYSQNWSKILLQLIKDSPNLQILDLEVDNDYESFEEYKPISWSSDPSLVPECLLKSLKTFKFKGYTEKEEERDFLSFIDKHARCLKSKSILPSDY